MPDEGRSDNVDKFLSEQALEDCKQALIADLLKQREAVMKEFDEKLAKLGYQASENSSQAAAKPPQESRAAAAEG